jgi:hypothetical protein
MKSCMSLEYKALILVNYVLNRGFKRRWEKALHDCQEYTQQQSNSANMQSRQFFWYNRYKFEETDSTRTNISIDELCQQPFEQRRWFGTSAPQTGLFEHQRDDPLNIFGHTVYTLPDVLLTGLKSPGLDCQFTYSGSFLGHSDYNVTYSLDEANSEVVLSCEGVQDRLIVRRTPCWGFQLNSVDVVLRSLDDKDGEYASSEKLWADLTNNLVMQERPADEVSAYNWREIVDDEELQFELPWRNSWRARSVFSRPRFIARS